MATHWVLNTLPPGNSLRQHLGSFARGTRRRCSVTYNMCGGESEPTTCTNYWGDWAGLPQLPLTHVTYTSLTHVFTQVLCKIITLDSPPNLRFLTR